MFVTYYIFGKTKLTTLVAICYFSLFAIFHDRENTFLNQLIKFALEKACVNRVRVYVNFEVLFWTFFKLRFLLFGIISLQIFRGHVCLRLLVVDGT